MRMEGVGLICLIAIHAAYDSLVLLGPSGPESIPGLSLLLFALRGVFVLWYYRQWQNRKQGEFEAPLAPRDEESAPVPESEPVESEEGQRLRRALNLMEVALRREGRYRIRLHVTTVNDAGEEKDLGPWPDVVAQVSRFDDAADLCSFLSHHLRLALFPGGRLQ
jgi:hypothetical protein